VYLLKGESNLLPGETEYLGKWDDPLSTPRNPHSAVLIRSHRPIFEGSETRHRMCLKTGSAVNVSGVIRWWSVCDALRGLFTVRCAKLLSGE
jgi:hypothetical protein